MRLTTVRVRPARSEMLADKGISPSTRDCLAVTVFGEAVGVVKCEEVESSVAVTVMWHREDFPKVTIVDAVQAALGLMSLAASTGVIPR